jgi:hypothetical protein
MSDLTPEQRINNIWTHKVLPFYRDMERNRLYASTPDSRRFMAWLWRSCAELEPENPAKLFKWSLETLADECGINVLQPLPPNELEPPEPGHDCFGDRLPNPFPDDLQGQTILTQRNPRLATLYKKAAESPWKFWAEWQDEQAANTKSRAIKYDADAHAANVFCNGANETDKAQFVRNADKATVERCKWEARPIEFPIGKSFNLTAQGKISRNPKLNGLVSAANNYEREWREGARAKARADIETAQKHLKELETVSPK